MARRTKIKDISLPRKQLVEIIPEELLELPYPYNHVSPELLRQLKERLEPKYDSPLDGTSVLGIAEPKNEEDKTALVNSFLNGLRKLLTPTDNWTFLQPLLLSLENCVKCQNCSKVCPIYIGSGKQDIYRPTYRSEVLRRIIRKYLGNSNRFINHLQGNDVELNWETVVRLAELAYRCTLCRKCVQACPIGIDNGLITHELRKLFSQEMGIAPNDLHDMGTVRQLKIGASTGMTPKALKGIVQFMEEEIEEKTNVSPKIPIDKEGADILLVHNTGEYLSWLDGPVAFSIIFNAAGLNWTLSSELFGYEATNYGLWYDDVQMARIALKHLEIAKKLGVKRIVVGECGHAHKALMVTAERLLTRDNFIPRESYLPLLEDIVCNGRIKLEPKKNDFPVTLHDPCNLVRAMGIVEPQRKILKSICPQFTEMEPHGVDNYCCGGGSGFSLISSGNFAYWRSFVAGRMKLQQVLHTFRNVIEPDVKKYVCAPCSNCKGQFRDMFTHYDVWEKCSIRYGGLVELVANAMVDVTEPLIQWEKFD